MESIEERVRKVVCECLGVNDKDMKNSNRFIEDLGADSLDAVELVMALEQELGMAIPDDVAEKITTVQHVIDYAKSHVQS
ncbi:acyl carrier protein [Pseudomonas sp. ADAK2]|uniref:acyl carrier protein n=1 Tax=Pseudomonas TaxID=286 RepID=UPI0014633F9F|nr:MULTISPECIES: acyl carrier protein [unclassified Pseudomonas]QJI41960.1 acyl carrier protein [Pseudomonas sp. ADAK7]QJI48263.1 acyl carrier protein [Pseudomonas sp. ADAK2]